MASEFSDAVNEFSFDIYQKCIIGNSSNIIISPLLVQSALALALMGAKGRTAEELKINLKFGIMSRDDIANCYKTFTDKNLKSPSVQLANKIYIQENLIIKQAFKEIAAMKFDSDTENVDFNKKSETITKINKWIESKTNDKIKEIIKPDMLNSKTRMVFVNAICFKGSWLHPFKEQHTKQSPFWLNKKKSIKVAMMFQQNQYKIGMLKNKNASIIEIPYRNCRLDTIEPTKIPRGHSATYDDDDDDDRNCDIAMLIILPMEKDGLKSVEDNLKNIDFNEMINDLSYKKVELTLPKFKVEFEIGLKKILQQMGMNTMFSNFADFSNLIESTDPVEIRDVFQKAFIETNEEGTEAIAVSVCEYERVNCATQIIVNRPFFYMIRNLKTNEILFTGRIINFNKQKK